MVCQERGRGHARSVGVKAGQTEDVSYKRTAERRPPTPISWRCKKCIVIMQWTVVNRALMDDLLLLDAPALPCG